MDAASDKAKRQGTLVYIIVGAAGCSLVAFAVVAYAGLRPHGNSPSGEAIAMLQSIRGSEEAYRAETNHYRSCPDSNDLSSADSYYPRLLGELNDAKAAWESATNANHACWRDLGAHSDGPVRFSYAVAAGSAGPMRVPRPPGVDAQDWPFDSGRQSAEPYFVAVAVGNIRGTVTASFVSSLDNEITTVTVRP